MANGMSTLVTGVVGLAGTAGAVTVGAALLRRAHPYLAAGHALASARATDPLPEVLGYGLAGLTVPVRPGPHGELFIGPGDPQPGRTLRRLVLSPLLARAQTGGGRLCPDQLVPFRLVVEFGGPNRDRQTLLRAYRLLDQQLRDHAPLLSRCVGAMLEPGAVTVAIAGIVDAREMLAAQHARYAFADGSFDDVGSPVAPPALVPMISEPWTRRFGWDGQEEFPSEERHLLHALVRSAHDEGRTVRITGVPGGSARTRRAFWDELLAAGVDVIGDTDQRALSRYLRRCAKAPEAARQPQVSERA
jgi:hypothetical protein